MEVLDADVRTRRLPQDLLDLSLTAREFVSKERAEELLEPLLQADTKITSVRLVDSHTTTVVLYAA